MIEVAQKKMNKAIRQISNVVSPLEYVSTTVSHVNNC